MGLEFRAVYNERIKEHELPFSFLKLAKHIGGFDFSFDPIFKLLLNSNYFVYSFSMFFLSFFATIILGMLIRSQLLKDPDVGSSRKVRVLKFTTHDNEFLLKCSGLITIITVLYSASSGFAVLCTFLLSMYSPIWSYNSLIRIVGCTYAKASVQLDSERPEFSDILVITMKSNIQSFEYDPSNPMKTNIILFNKISLIGKS